MFNCHINAITFHSFIQLCADWLFLMTDFRFQARPIDEVSLTPPVIPYIPSSITTKKITIKTLYLGMQCSIYSMYVAYD